MSKVESLIEGYKKDKYRDEDAQKELKKKQQNGNSMIGKRKRSEEKDIVNGNNKRSNILPEVKKSDQKKVDKKAKSKLVKVD